MVSITVSVPEEIRKKMKEFPEINWSAIVRKTLIEKINHLSLKEQLKLQLKKDRKFNDWAVQLIRKGRKNETSSRH